MYEADGAELAELLAKVKERGVTVTLDMAKPDPDSPAGRADWHGILQRVLPYVDYFFPSFEEILYMLDRAEYERLLAAYPHDDIIRYAAPELLARLSGSMLAMGAAAVMIKLGEHGVYVRCSADRNRWLRAGKCTPPQLEGWLGRELLAPVFRVEAVGTTGAGDCTIAGFLAGIVKGLTLEATVTAAVAVGASSVEQSDATSGIPGWEQIQARLAQGWERRQVKLRLDGWANDETNGLFYGPHDKGRV
ncbi:carbohydrate kinase family protein [Gordoniibacillus kamchatkensis]|uniref:carbohydrate kinase family protein n=1 Tax=Gordoniibacillus kamchatkensis TaxID=1590651 RepID=UPI001E616B09|nr:carbohydrate kinase family protein [Paenibacillus sp. VKM B-2647]